MFSFGIHAILLVNIIKSVTLEVKENQKFTYSPTLSNGKPINPHDDMMIQSDQDRKGAMAPMFHGMWKGWVSVFWSSGDL